MMTRLHVVWPIILVMVLLGVIVFSYLFWVLKYHKIKTKAVLYYDFAKKHDLLATSPFISSWKLALLRTVFGIYCLASLIYTLVRFGGKMYDYYTVWNFTILVYYWLSSAYLTYVFCYCVSALEKKQNQKATASIQGPNPSQVMAANSSQVMVTNSSCQTMPANQEQTQQSMYPALRQVEEATVIEMTVEQCSQAQSQASNNCNKSKTMTNDEMVQCKIDSISSLEKAFRLSVWFTGLHQMCCAILVDVVVWAILFPLAQGDTRLFQWDDINMHILNVFMIGLDFFLIQQPYEFHLLVFVLLIAYIYSYWSWIMFTVIHFWPYSFLNVTKPFDSVAYVIIGIGHLGFWILLYFLYRFRQSVVHPCLFKCKRSNTNK